MPLDKEVAQLDEARKDGLYDIAGVDALLRVDRALVHALKLLVYLEIADIEHPKMPERLGGGQLHGLNA